MDFTSDLADISVGGAFPLKEWSIVIIRTKKGENLFQNAVKSGIIKTRSMGKEPDVFERLIALAMYKKKIALREAKKLGRQGKPVPPAVSRLLLHLPYEISILNGITIGDVMTRDVMTVNPKITVNRLLDIMTKHHHMGYPVVNEKNELIGIVTFEDVARVPKQERNDVLVKNIASKKLIVAYPEESVLEAFERMTKNEIGRILIIDRANHKKLRGILTRTNVMHSLRKHLPVK